MDVKLDDLHKKIKLNISVPPDVSAERTCVYREKGSSPMTKPCGAPNQKLV